ncbi:hypothetical protein EYC80_007766 [Monilinia laxa]|uniref:Uncharacterized protein n=1 Tax=Monilinia laxa TaxID=61186 RepID=A0A5N6JWY9_MONLA|nr:hypothetical protein EYC80_007766 [Monilinia laxa]
MSGSFQTRQSRARHGRHGNNSAGNATIEVVDYDYDGSEVGEYPDAVEDPPSENREPAVDASPANESQPSYTEDRYKYRYRNPQVVATPPQDYVPPARDQYRRPRVVITPPQDYVSPTRHQYRRPRVVITPPQDYVPPARDQHRRPRVVITPPQDYVSPTRHQHRRPRVSIRPPRACASPTRNQHRRPGVSTRSPQARTSPTRNQHRHPGVSIRPPQVRVSYVRADRREDLSPPPRQYSSRHSPLAHGNPSRQRSPVARQNSYLRRSPSPTSYGGYIPSPPTRYPSDYQSRRRSGSYTNSFEDGILGREEEYIHLTEAEQREIAPGNEPIDLDMRESEVMKDAYDGFGRGRFQDVNENQNGPEFAVTNAYFDNAYHNLYTETATGYQKRTPLSEHAQNNTVYHSLNVSNHWYQEDSSRYKRFVEDRDMATLIDYTPEHRYHEVPDTTEGAYYAESSVAVNHGEQVKGAATSEVNRK